MSDLRSTGIPGWWRSMCWNSLSTHRAPDVLSTSDVCCSFGAQVSPHLLSSCWHIEVFYLSKDSGCMFRHMALHFRLFWQPNMIQQPIFGPRLNSGRATKNKQAICWATTRMVRLILLMKATKWLERKKESYYFIWLWEMVVCFISLHYNIYNLHALQRHAELQ